MPYFDFELSIEGEDLQIIRVNRATFEEARAAAEENAAELRAADRMRRGPYSLELIRMFPGDDDYGSD
jgi:hypothetical protein